MILLIDNYDSFVYNLARYVEEAGFDCIVVRNDKISITEIERLQPEKIILSPGPKTPNEAGICLHLIEYFYKKIPILGVCLGHQAIGQVFGGKVVRALEPMHGKAESILHDKSKLYTGISNPITVARYHSLVICNYNLPRNLIVTARSGKGEIMSIAHNRYNVFGVQFHPESILTTEGFKLIMNFLNL